jgi:hypothetical protein
MQVLDAFAVLVERLPDGAYRRLIALTSTA